MISHDLGLAASFADEVVVMYAGRTVERAPVRELFGNVRMPYTSALLGAVPRLDRAAHTPLPVVGGRPPALSAPRRRRRRCAFAPRCPRADERCERERPELAEDEPGHWYACWYPLAGIWAGGSAAALGPTAAGQAASAADAGEA